MKSLEIRTPIRRKLRLGIGFLALLLAPMMAAAQDGAKPASSWAGKYEGVAKAAAGDLKITLDLADDQGKFSGKSTTPKGTFDIVKGQVAKGVLSLDLKSDGATAKLTLRQGDNKLSGDWAQGGQTVPVELKKGGSGDAVDAISGDWDGLANTGDGNYNFTLALKLQGDAVNGSSTSDLGSGTVKGTFKDGKLVFQIEGSFGVVSMAATLQEGKLAGEFDYSGQAQGKWVAVRHK